MQPGQLSSTAAKLQLQSWSELRQFVSHTLAELDALDAQACRLSEFPLEQSGQPCGTIFSLHGPRNLRLTATWDAKQRQLHFYNSQGTRVKSASLETAPS